jgi:hypothetical protein
MLRSIKTFIRDPDPVDNIEEVEPGLNIVEGIVHVEEPIRSPVKGQNCVAFFYRSFLIISGGRAPAMHKLKQAEVYTNFKLEMTGGTLQVVPKTPGRFEQRDHQALQQQYGTGFQGIEEVVMPGARVRIRGKVKKQGDALVMVTKEITVIDKQAVASGVVSYRKKRRRKKK